MILDIEEVSASYDPKIVHRVVAAMMDNALEAMPNGGELEATLINAEHQWELEIADSGNGDKSDSTPAKQTDAKLPRIVGVETSPHIEVLNQLGILMNATIQSWNCPLGGTASVLVVPKMSGNEQTINKAA